MAKENDSLLSMGEVEGIELHRNAALIEVAEAGQLEAIAQDSRLGRFLLCRLSKTVAVVDPGRAEAFAQALLAAGHTPKRVKGVSA